MIETAGILLYRVRPPFAEVLLVHFGGPFWAGKDKNAWSIPKGVINRGEDPLAAAKREFAEETGSPVRGEPLFLGRYHQNGKKNLSLWMVEGDFDPRALRSNSFKMVWPPKSGKLQTYLEVDQAEWFNEKMALQKVIRGQAQPLRDCFDKIEGKYARQAAR